MMKKAFVSQIARNLSTGVWQEVDMYQTDIPEALGLPETIEHIASAIDKPPWSGWEVVTSIWIPKDATHVMGVDEIQPLFKILH